MTKGKVIHINIPENFIPERKYIVNTLFKEFLGIDVKIQVKKTDNYEILVNDNNLTVIDNFFSKIDEKENYLDIKNIPTKIIYGKNEFCTEDDIPIIYGMDKTISNEKKITCHIDIFASSFFMLSRWEEYVIKKRDKHDRFPPEESLAYKAGFISRPVVNEYAQMLLSLLKKLGLSHTNNRKYKAIITHDIDIHKRWRSVFQVAYVLCMDLIKRNSISEFTKNVKSVIKSVFDYKKDPYYLYDYFMNFSDKNGLKSHFFFMSGKGNFDEEGFYDINSKYIRKIIEHIEEKGHFIGFHPSYDTYNKPEKWKKEKDELQKNVAQKIKSGRQHYLRFEVPKTWQIWEDDGMEWDSSVYYSDVQGFRCGACHEFSVFNILARKPLKLKEYPLSVMEGTFMPRFSPRQMETEILKIIQLVKKYNGTFVLLWHNSNFNNSQWDKYQYIYEKIIKSSLNIKTTKEKQANIKTTTTPPINSGTNEIKE